MQNETGAHTARLGDYFTLLRRQWLVVLLGLAIGLGAAFAYLQWAPKEYRSTASVHVYAMETDSAGGIDGRNGGINLDTEAQLVTSTETVALAAEKLGEDARGLADRVGISVPPNTEILDIAYTGSSAADAQKGAAAFAEAYLELRQSNGEAVLARQAEALQSRIDAVQRQLDATDEAAADAPEDSAQRARLERTADQLNSQIATLESNRNRLETETLNPGLIVTEPRLPSSPSSPNPLVTLAAGLLLGILLGAGVAALRHRADDVIRTPDDLFRRTRVPVAAVLSTRLHAGQVQILKPLSADGRGYARLRNLVTTSLEESQRRVVLVAGVRRGGGPVAANLAASLARSGEDVFLVCADVFGPTAAALLDAPAVPGLAEVLAGEQTLEAATQELPGIPNLLVLAPGLDPDRADALLQTRGPRKLIDDLLATATYVVIEAPPTTDSPDAQTLAGVADLAVLVVEAGQSSAREVVDAVAQLESMHAAVLGAVIARYGRDSDTDPRRRTAGLPPADESADEVVDDSLDEPVHEPVDETADEAAEEPAEGTAEPPVVAEPVTAPVASQAAAPATQPVGESTVVPTGGRPQLVPPRSAGPSGR